MYKNALVIYAEPNTEKIFRTAIVKRLLKSDHDHEVIIKLNQGPEGHCDMF